MFSSLDINFLYTDYLFSNNVSLITTIVNLTLQMYYEI